MAQRPSRRSQKFPSIKVKLRVWLEAHLSAAAFSGRQRGVCGGLRLEEISGDERQEGFEWVACGGFLEEENEADAADSRMPCGGP